jgi:competence protein ComEA
MSGIVVKDGWRDRLETLAGRRFDAWVITGLVVVVAAVSLVLWFRGSPPAIAPPARVVASAQGTSAPGGAPVLVHVAGAVREPGVYELTDGSRVADAIASAGGSRARANLDALNLASVVTDGMQILIPSRTASPAHTTSSAPVPLPATPASALVNINTADQPALETIPGVGPVTAIAILEYRESVGSFTSVEELIDVSGIGPATLEEMRPYVTV